MTYKYPKLKQPPKPKIAIIDGDSILFKAASAGEKTWYVATDPDGNEITRFDSAKAYDAWLEELDILGFSLTAEYSGSVDELTRSIEYEILDVELCYKAFDHTVKEWCRMAGIEDYIVYIGKATGARNFRYDLATIHPYKKGRENTRKPHHLEAVRKYAASKSNVKIVRGAIEVDDRVVELAEKYKHNSVLCGLDKDSTQARGCWHLFVGFSDEPFFVSKKNVGNIKPEGKKIFATSFLRVALQLLEGDKSVDGIAGLPKYGPKKAYKLLQEFDGVDLQHLPEVFSTVAREYKKVYGGNHTYEHCYTGEPITRDWYEMFEENLRLLWMKRHKDDKGEHIMKMVEELR